MKTTFLARVALSVLCLVVVQPSSAASQDRGCLEDPAFAALDFWIGDWVVRVDGEKVGDNRIEKVLSGCAVMERWTDLSESEGMSLFYYVPAADEWKQVWVTDSPRVPGGVKEKTLRARLVSGAVQFEGEVLLVGGGRYTDRTTLTPLPDGSVRQVIELTRDRSLWETVFDGLYVRKKTP